MATQNINIGINVSDNGTAKKTVKSFQEITQAATQAQRAAQGINAAPVKSTLAPGGTNGSRMVAARAAPSGSQGMSSEQYGNLRGTAGLTGASGRDFAQQAQGLGGVVRLYATYAANVFAVGAAFRALSGAMDTANLVKGLDQLGAASGTALGTLSKRLVDVTDGAISMREAMESTAKAVSSGMSSENLLRMGKVAKQAAQALGVDMSDAVNRLTRGITKLEPELLDELGIFTRVDIATQAYAKSVGKSTSAITDFEKRMAFANSVLEEGERKFSAIDFETNPYTKLLATLKDVAQVGLEVTNTVIAPIVKFLSENPKALAVAIGALGVVLVKQALPAIGQFKASLASAATQAAELSKTRSADALKAQRQLASILQAEQAQFLDSQDQLLDTAAETLKKAGLGAGSVASKLINTNMVGIDPEGVKQVENQIKNVRIEAGKYARLVQENIKAGENPVVIEALRAKAEAYYDTAYAAETVLAGEVAAVEKNSRGIAENTIAKLNNNLAEKARVASIKQSIVANAAYNGSLVGFTGAMKLANVELDKSGLQLGFFRKNLLLARAGVAAFGGMVSRVMSSIGGFLNVIAMVGAGVAFLSSFLSANAKQMSAFSGAADATDESLLNLGRTLDNINSKPFGQQFNTQSLMASATAINEITSSVGSLISKTLEADKAASGFDKVINSFKGIWGGDLRTQFAKSISGTVFGTLEKLGDSPEAKKARDSIAGIIEVSPNSSRKDWQSAFKAISDNEPKLRLVEQAMKDLGIATSVTAGKAEGFDNALKSSEDAYKNFANQFKTSDPLAQLAESLIASGIKTAQAIEVPEMAIARLASVVGDVNKIALFDEQDQTNLLKYGDSITKTNQEFEKNKQAVKASKEEIVKLQAQLEKFRTTNVSTGLDSTDEEMSGNRAFDAAKKQLDARREQLNKEQALVASTLVEITTLTARFPSLASGQLLKGADMLSSSISASLSKGSSAFAEAVLSSVGDLPGLAKERERIELRKLDSEARLIKIQTELARATILNSAELRRASAIQAVETAKAGVNLGVGSFRDPEAENRLKEAEKTLSELDKSIAVIKVDPSNALAALKTIKSEIASGNKVIQQDAASLFEFVNSLAGLSLQKQNNETAKRATAYKTIIDGVKEEFKQSSKTLTNQREENALLIANYALQKARNGSLTEAESISAQEAQAQAITLERNQKLLAIGEKLAVLAQAQSTGETALAEEVFQKERGLLLDQVSNVVREAGSKISSSELTTSKEIYENQQRLVALENELVSIRKSGTFALQDASDKIRDIANQTAKDIGTYTPEYQAQQDVLLQIAKTRGEAERAEQQLTSEFIIRSYALQAEAEAKIRDRATPESVNATIAKLTAEAEAYGNKVTAINSTRDAELNAINQIEAARQNQTSFDNTIESIKALDTVWENFGSTLADTVSVFINLSKSQEQYARTLAKLESERDAETDAKKKIELQQKIDQTTKASVRSEITGYGKVAGESKKLFKEKTGAYKTLAAVEKTMHLTTLALEAKELAFKLKALLTGTAAKGAAEGKETAITLAGFASRLGTYIKEIYASWGRLGPWMVGAAALFIASKLGGSGGGSGGFTPNAEQRQETQGTAMGYDSSGNKVQVRRGVLGDTDAKSESIVNSLEIIKNNSVDGLSYDNRMLKLLSSIDSGINNTAKGLFSIQGLRTGSMFGTITGSQSGGGVLGSGFLGSKTSRNITDSGLLIEGTFAQLASDTNKAVIDFFEQVTVSKRSWYGKTKTWVETQRKEIDDATSEFFQDIFGNATKLFIEVGSKVGIEASAINEILGTMNLGKDFTSLRGLKGEDFQKELSAVIGTILDDAALAIFSSFESFAEFGEGMLETVIRVVDTNDKINQQIKNVGINSGELSFAIAETLAELAGGLENFLDQTNFFRENFLSEAERLVPVQEAVNAEMARLGFASVTTREGFKQLVQGLDLTTAAGLKNFQALMSVQEGFIKVTQRLEDLKTESSSLEIELLKAKGRTIEAEAALDKLATEGMNQAELAVYSYNKSLQKQIEALNDSKAAIEKATQAITTAEKAVESIRNRATDQYIAATEKVAQAQKTIADLAIEAAKKMQSFGKSLRDFVKSQLMPESSAQNAAQAFALNTRLALAGDTSAIEKVPELAQAAIDAAKASARSSAEFNSTRAAILAGVTNVAKFAEEQASLTIIPADQDPLVLANQSLEDALREQTQALKVANTIGASLVRTPEDLIAEYTKANQDLATAVAEKIAAEGIQTRSLAALNAIVDNTVATNSKLTEVNDSISSTSEETATTVADLNNQNLLTITNNTAITVLALSDLLDNNIALFNAMNSVAVSTSALANAVKAGSGGAAVSSGSDGGNFLGIFGKGLDVAGKVVDVAYSALKSVGNAIERGFKKLFSDERTKKDITLHSRLSNGIGIYDYNYKSPYDQYYGSDRKRGVLAQEVKDKYPGAVSTSTNGMYMVDYSKLPVPTDILKFATGGVFSNQVVTRPTSFELGLMGESGPEAIMPLARTSSGQLGVVAQTAPGESTTREMLTQNAELIQEVRQLREEVSLLRYEARATASATNKTTRILERVTRDGESLLVTDAATV
jgi:hypothetical protein